MKVKKIAAIALASACAFSMAAVDFNGHRKPVWYASRDFFAPRLATIQPRTSEEYRETHSWEGVSRRRSPRAHRAQRHERAVQGSWAVNRVDFDGNVLATQQIDDVELDAASHKGFPLNEEIVDFGDANNELIVAVPSDDSFARVIYNPAEILTQELDAPADAFTTKAKRTADGVELTVTANDYVRDLFCMVGKVDDKATVEEGLVSLLPGESVTFTSAPTTRAIRPISPPPTCCVARTTSSATSSRMPRGICKLQ